MEDVSLHTNEITIKQQQLGCDVIPEFWKTAAAAARQACILDRLTIVVLRSRLDG